MAGASVAVLLNGRPEKAPLALHRALHYGDGVFRTCLIYSGQVIDIKEQTNKLAADALRLGLSIRGLASLRREAAALAEGKPRAVLKMLLLRSGAERGYRAAGRAADRMLCRLPAPAFPARWWEQGITLFRTSFRLAAQPALAGIKHLNRLEQVLASRDWPAGAGEGVVEDEQGRPLGGTRTNLFWVKDGVLRTPALDRCGVAGRMRDRVLDAAGGLGHAFRVEAGGWSELEEADEVFVTNSLIGIWPVRALDKRRWTAGPLTRRLMDKLDHPRLTA